MKPADLVGIAGVWLALALIGWMTGVFIYKTGWEAGYTYSAPCHTDSECEALYGPMEGD